MGSDVGQIFPTASLHRDHSILYALVCEKELSHMGKNKTEIPIWCARIVDQTVNAKYSSRKLQASEEPRLKQLDFMLF